MNSVKLSLDIVKEIPDSVEAGLTSIRSLTAAVRERVEADDKAGALALLSEIDNNAENILAAGLTGTAQEELLQHPALAGAVV